MASALDVLININQKMGGDDAIGKLKQIDAAIKGEEKSLASLQRQAAKMTPPRGLDGRFLKKGSEEYLAAIKAAESGVVSLGTAGESAGSKAAGGMAAMSSAAGGALGVIKGVAAAVLALGVAIVAVGAQLSAFALQAANAHRTMLLMFSALSGGKSAGEANAKAIEKVASSTALAKEQVEGIAKRLAVAGLSGKMFEETLKTISQASALLGEEAGAHLESILEKSKALGHFQFSDKQLKGLGLSMGDVAKQLGMTETAFKSAMKTGKITVEQGMDAMNKAMAKRFGAENAAMMLDFNVQLLKLKENVTALFKDVNVEPFLKALHELLSVFDQTSTSGKVIHFLMKTLFDAIFNGAATALPFVKAGLMAFLIVVLRGYIALRQFQKALDEAFPPPTKADGMTRAITLGTLAGYVLVGAMILVAAAMKGVEMAFVGAMAIADGLVATWGILSGVASAVWSAVVAAFDMPFPDLAVAAVAMVTGLVEGLLGGVGGVVAAMTSLGGAAKSALMVALGIHSPSRVMAQLGGYTSEGFAKGVEDSEGKAQGAMASMAAPPSAGGAKGGKRGGGDVYHIVIHAAEAKGKEIAEALADYLEGKGITAAVATEAEAAT